MRKFLRKNQEAIKSVVAGALMGSAIGFFVLKAISYYAYTTSDTFVRDRTLLLYNQQGSCTGTLITLNKGANFTLTAAHCAPLVSPDKTVLAANEAGEVFVLKLIKIDVGADLMLLSNPLHIGLELGQPTFSHQHVKTVSWGDAQPSYRTDGEVLYPFIQSIDNCYTLECIAGPPVTMMTTNHILPGASGGPLLDDSNRLVGITVASNMRNDFTLAVAIEQIRSFVVGTDR